MGTGASAGHRLGRGKQPGGWGGLWGKLGGTNFTSLEGWGSTSQIGVGDGQAGFKVSEQRECQCEAGAGLVSRYCSTLRDAMVGTHLTHASTGTRQKTYYIRARLPFPAKLREVVVVGLAYQLLFNYNYRLVSGLGTWATMLFQGLGLKRLQEVLEPATNKTSATKPATWAVNSTPTEWMPSS